MFLGPDARNRKGGDGRAKPLRNIEFHAETCDQRTENRLSCALDTAIGASGRREVTEDGPKRPPLGWNDGERERSDTVNGSR